MLSEGDYFEINRTYFLLRFLYKHDKDTQSIQEIDSAITKLFKQIIEIGPNNPNLAEAYNLLGSVYLGQEKFDSAITKVQKAIDLRPKNPYSYYKLGLVYQQQGEFDDAIMIYQKVDAKMKMKMLFKQQSESVKKNVQ